MLLFSCENLKSKYCDLQDYMIIVSDATPLQSSFNMHHCLPCLNPLDIGLQKINMHVLFLQRALETLGFSQEDIVNVFKIVASVLKLGNIGFIPTNNIDGTEGCTINNDYGQLNDFSSVTVFCIKWC
jgi:hypothetical protein